MIAPALKLGDTIGLCAPCWGVDEAWAENVRAAAQEMGFHVQYAPNLFAQSWGYIASPEERAEDINALIRDERVRLIFFGGGEGAEDVVPLIDYEAAAAHPKRWLSYSDGTSILLEVWRRTGLSTLYGQSPGFLPTLSPYNKEQFLDFVTQTPSSHRRADRWLTLTPGRASGTLIGGYLGNFLFAAALGRIPEEGKYILCLEDNERFQSEESMCALLGRLEHCPVMARTAGILLGHYDVIPHAPVLQRLKRLGEKWGIPVAYCDDFGHGANHAVFPFGVQAVLDTWEETLYWNL